MKFSIYLKIIFCEKSQNAPFFTENILQKLNLDFYFNSLSTTKFLILSHENLWGNSFNYSEVIVLFKIKCFYNGK